MYHEALDYTWARRQDEAIVVGEHPDYDPVALAVVAPVKVGLVPTALEAHLVSEAR